MVCSVSHDYLCKMNGPTLQAIVLCVVYAVMFHVRLVQCWSRSLKSWRPWSFHTIMVAFKIPMTIIFKCTGFSNNKCTSPIWPTSLFQQFICNLAIAMFCYKHPEQMAMHLGTIIIFRNNHDVENSYLVRWIQKYQDKFWEDFTTAINKHPITAVNTWLI